MTSFAIHHGVLPIYTGQILGTENAHCMQDVRMSKSLISECNKQSSGKYGKIQDGLEASIR